MESLYKNDELRGFRPACLKAPMTSKGELGLRLWTTADEGKDLNNRWAKERLPTGEEIFVKAKVVYDAVQGLPLPGNEPPPFVHNMSDLHLGWLVLFILNGHINPEMAHHYWPDVFDLKGKVKKDRKTFGRPFVVGGRPGTFYEGQLVLLGVDNPFHQRDNTNDAVKFDDRTSPRNHITDGLGVAYLQNEWKLSEVRHPTVIAWNRLSGTFRNMLCSFRSENTNVAWAASKIAKRQGEDLHVRDPLEGLWVKDRAGPLSSSAIRGQYTRNPAYTGHGCSNQTAELDNTSESRFPNSHANLYLDNVLQLGPDMMSKLPNAYASDADDVQAHQLPSSADKARETPDCAPTATSKRPLSPTLAGAALQPPPAKAPKQTSSAWHDKFPQPKWIRWKDHEAKTSDLERLLGNDKSLLNRRYLVPISHFSELLDKITTATNVMRGLQHLYVDDQHYIRLAAQTFYNDARDGLSLECLPKFPTTDELRLLRSQLEALEPRKSTDSHFLPNYLAELTFAHNLAARMERGYHHVDDEPQKPARPKVTPDMIRTVFGPNGQAIGRQIVWPAPSDDDSDV